MRETLREGRRQGDVAAEPGFQDVAASLMATITRIRLAARYGAGNAQISAVVNFALCALW